MASASWLMLLLAVWEKCHAGGKLTPYSWDDDDANQDSFLFPKLEGSHASHIRTGDTRVIPPSHDVARGA
jgi:hypothetical protein